MNNPILTIGMATYDDYEGVYFTIQALRMYHEICNSEQVEIIVIDNNPNSEYGKATKTFIEHQVRNGKYIPYTKKISTSVRNELFNHAKGKYTLCMDCHVFIIPNGINSLLNYYEENINNKNIITGPLIYDDLKNVSTHFDPVWSHDMFGLWGSNQEYLKNKPFEIPMQGCGLFSCQTNKWLGFNEHFIGFGGEEWYIQEKFRMFGGKCICLPQLKWMHRFTRVNSVPYRLLLEDRIFNYYIGWIELYEDPEHEMVKSITDHFKNKISINVLDNIKQKAINLLK